MTARMIGLRALRHPLALLSIGMLLLNDHVLKGMIPSALTGKLSDFAGLFFFPFLLASLFGLAGDRLRLPVRGTGMLAFGVTGGWFTLIKTVPLANAWTADLAGWLWGGRVQIVLDPTDLVALAVLLPAWGLWRRMERPAASMGQSPGRLAYLALGAASLAALATSCPAPMSLDRLAVEGHTLYAYDVFAPYNTEPSIYASQDGLHWQSIPLGEISDEARGQLEQAVQFPVASCEAENPARCYRITGDEQVESSSDGGNTWQVAWQIPWGRKEFMRRYPSFPCGKGELDTTPKDLALLPGQEGVIVVVAMGNEGLLTRAPDGEWHRIGIGSAAPTPFRETRLDSLMNWVAFTLSNETVLPLLAALLFGGIYDIVGAGLLLSLSNDAERNRPRWVAVPIGWAILLLVVQGLLGGIWMSNVSVVALLFVLMALTIGISHFLIWERVSELTHLSELAHRSRTIGFCAGLGLFPLSWLPFVAWVYAIIPLYALALGLSILIGAASLTAAVFGLCRVARQLRAHQAA